MHESKVERAVGVLLTGTRVKVHQCKGWVWLPTLQRKQAQVVIRLGHARHGRRLKVLQGPEVDACNAAAWTYRW